MPELQKEPISAQVQTPVEPVQYHAHGMVELTLVTRGDIRFGMHGAVRTLRAGEMAVVAPYVVHGVLSADAAASCMVLRFDPALYGPQAGRALELLSCGSGWSADWPPETAQRLTQIPPAVCTELEQRGQGWELAVAAQIWQLPVAAAREMPRLGEHAPALCPAQAILREIAQHYTGELTLSGCAESLGISFHYLSLLFQQKFGASFTPYLAAIRLRHAEWLLQNAPALGVTEVAFAAGFQSIQTFNRVFKQQNGISPREYRQRARM